MSGRRCRANGCPNDAQVDVTRLCAEHHNAAVHDWPSITGEIRYRLAMRAAKLASEQGAAATAAPARTLPHSVVQQMLEATKARILANARSSVTPAQAGAHCDSHESEAQQ